MDKTLFKELEKKAIIEQKRVAPIVGHWYKISYEQESKWPNKKPRHSLRLCTNIKEHDGPNIYMVGIGELNMFSKMSIFPDELRYAEWPKTNKFHRFCLTMLSIQLGEKPINIDIYKDFKLYVLMETILLSKVIDAKNATEAIRAANKAVEKGTKARLNQHPYGYFNAGIENQTFRQEVRKAFGWLLQEYRECK